MKTLHRLQTDWLLATEMNKLEARIWRVAQRDGLQTILFTSGVRGEGKSTTVAYLATQLGMYPDRRILAIDFDFRIPNLNRHFGIGGHAEFDRVLTGGMPIEEAITKTELPALDVLLPSSNGAEPTLLLRTREIARVVATLRERYDLILIDTPAIIPVADTMMLLPLADGVVLIGVAGKTTEPQLRRAREICEGVDANILGMVVGNIEEAAPEYVVNDYDYYGGTQKGGREERPARPRKSRTRPPRKSRR